MAFELYENTSLSKDTIPYFLNVQHDICRLLGTRVVVPVVRDKPANSQTDFVVPMMVGSMTCYAVISHLAAVPLSVLGAVVADCSEYYDAIRSSVDRLFIGF